DYERMYYAWRIVTDTVCPNPLAEEMLDLAARAYRRGTSQLYAHNMVGSARPFHRLALACFAGRPLGLQELLEAATGLSLAPEIGIHPILDRIGFESVRKLLLQRDDFFT